jgi:hypothetical protein
MTKWGVPTAACLLAVGVLLGHPQAGFAATTPPGPAQAAADPGSIQLTIPAGPLFISTPFHPNGPNGPGGHGGPGAAPGAANLAALRFHSRATEDSRRSTIGGISVTDTRAEGGLAWTMTTQVTSSGSPQGGLEQTITVTVG